MRADKREQDYEHADEDTELMLRARNDDSVAFEKLYRKYAPLMYVYLTSRHNWAGSAADIIQEVFTRLWAQRYRYQARAKFKTYLFAHVKIVCLEKDGIDTKQRTLANRFLQEFSRVIASPATPEMVVNRVEMNELLERALAQLSTKQREALQLYYTERMSLHEAAQSMGCTQKCFESRLSRGRTKLRQLLRTSGGTP